MNMVEVPVERVKEIQAMNRKGKKPAKLFETAQHPANQSVSADLLEDSSLTRFDPRTPGRSPKKRSNKKRRRFNGKKNTQ